MKILIVEDNQDSRDYLDRLCSNWGYDPEIATCGTDALDALRADIESPRLVLLDWMLPEMDGIEVCRRIRSDPQLAATYIILLTARAAHDDVVTGLEGGADDYVSKPFSHEELHARISVGTRILSLQRDLLGKVTELEQALKSVQDESKARSLLAAAMEQVEECIAISDPDGVLRYVNPALERTTQMKREEILGRKVSLYSDDGESESLEASIQDALTKGGVWTGHRQVRASDDSLRRVVVTITAIRNRWSEVLQHVIVMRDISRGEYLMEQAFRMQKVNVIGQITSGIAHEFNNLMGAVTFNAVAAQEKATDPFVVEALQNVVLAASSAASFAHDLLNFARISSKEQNEIRVRDLVNQAVSILRHEFERNGVAIRIDIPESLLVRVDIPKIQQVVVNLLKNALEISLRDSEVLISSRADPSWLEIEVRDQGQGVEHDFQSRMFEPFVTTKTGSGNKHTSAAGLGLFLCREIVALHGGTIRCESDPGKSLSMIIQLPNLCSSNREPHVLESSGRSHP